MKVKVNASKLKQAIEKTLPFVSPIVAGQLGDYPNVQLRFETGRVTAVATDGHRLTLVEFPEALTLPSPVEAVLSAATLLDLLPTLNDGDAELDLSRLVRKQANGKFPDWQTVLPREEEWTHLAVVDRDLLRAALKRALIIADSRSHALQLDLSSEQVTVFAKSDDAGEFDETLYSPRTSGDPLRVGFSGRYLLDFLEAAARGPIHMTFRDETSVGDFRALGEEDVSYRYLLMPMRGVR